MIEMGSRRDLRDDTTVRRVLGELRLHQIGADTRPPGTVGDDRHCGLIAAGFDAENG
jgi:hypothetical protein